MRCHRIRPPIGLSARRVARRDTEFDALDRPEMGDGLGLKGLTLTQTFQDLKPWTPLFKLKSGISDQTASRQNSGFAKIGPSFEPGDL